MWRKFLSDSETYIEYKEEKKQLHIIIESMYDLWVLQTK